MKVLGKIRSLFEKRALRQGSIALLDQGFLSIATFVTGVLVARACSKEEYSLYVLGWSLVLIIQGIHRALVNVPFMIYAPRLDESNKKIYQGSTFVHTLFLCALTMAAVVVTYTYSALSENEDSVRLASFGSVLAVAASCVLLREYMRNVLFARLEIRASATANMAATALQLGVVVWLFTMAHLTISYAFASFAATSVLAAGYMIWAHRKQMQIVRAKLWRDLVGSLRIGKWVLLETISYMGASQAYPWLLLYFVDSNAVAAYGACLAIAGFATPFLRGANAYIQPRMAHSYKDANIANLLRLLRLSVFVLGVPYGIWLVIGSLYSEEILTLFYTQSYSGYGVLVCLLLIKTMIESVSTPLSNALQTLERADVVTVSYIIGATATLGLGSFLIPKFGLNGAGIAAAVSSLATLLWRWGSLKRIISQKSLSTPVLP